MFRSLHFRGLLSAIISEISNGVSSFSLLYTSVNGTSSQVLIGNSDFTVTFFLSHVITPMYIFEMAGFLDKGFTGL